ncbi:MAG: hypothetical protein VYA34_00665 [Myxococcota bacterium]|nr:hypothetical protein [Myxococcota bacterium]
MTPSSATHGLRQCHSFITATHEGGCSQSIEETCSHRPECLKSIVNI